MLAGRTWLMCAKREASVDGVRPAMMQGAAGSAGRVIGIVKLQLTDRKGRGNCPSPVDFPGASDQPGLTWPDKFMAALCGSTACQHC